MQRASGSATLRDAYRCRFRLSSSAGSVHQTRGGVIEEKDYSTGSCKKTNFISTTPSQADVPTCFYMREEGSLNRADLRVKPTKLKQEKILWLTVAAITDKA